MCLIDRTRQDIGCEKILNLFDNCISHGGPVRLEKACGEAVGSWSFFGWMEKRASLISEAEEMEINMSFVACDTEGCIARDITSEQSEVDAVKILWKYPIIVSTIFALSKTSAPVPSSITVSLFLARLPLVEAWKNPVFLSSKVSQRCMLRCFQYSSSAL